MQPANIAVGPTHLNSAKWMDFNTVGGGLALFLILGTFVYLGYKSRGAFERRIRDWHESMKMKEEQKETEEEKSEDLEHTEPKQEDNEQ